MKFIIERSKWLRGEGEGDSQLLRIHDQKMCCLGMVAIQCGATKEQIETVQSPCGAMEVSWPEPLMPPKAMSDSAAASRLMVVNDRVYRWEGYEPTDLWNNPMPEGGDIDEWLPDSDREKRLKEIALEFGIELEFVD